VHRFGRAAGFPTLLSFGERRLLSEAHGDVVELVTPRIDGRAVWRGWEGWPS
jgi:hypothetical protein